MYNNSVAQNHISELARQGRYGDDMLVHMNKEEAATLARAAGLDKLPINPQTGLPEAFAIMGALAIGKGLLGAVSSIKGAKDEASQSRAQSRMISEQMAGIDSSIQGLEGVKESKQEVAKQEYSQQLGDLSMQTGQSKEDLQQQYQQSIQKSGLATSGGAEARSSQTYRRIQQQFGKGSKSLLGQLGKSMAGVEEWYESEKSRLESEKQRLSHEKRTADAQAKSAKGKGLMGAVGAGIGAAMSFFSDISLKNNIDLIGKSPSGINIYEFNYIWSEDKRYTGVMANEILSDYPNAVSIKDGYLTVDYSLIDVDFEEVI